MRLCAQRTRSATRRFRRDRGGAAMVEFAVVGPIFLFLALLLIEIGLLGLAQSSFRNGVREAGRETLVGADRCSSAVEVVEFVCNRAIGLPECRTRLSITRRSLGGGGGAFTETAASDLVLLEVSYPWPALSPLVEVALGDARGEVLLTQGMVVRSEAFTPAECS